MTATALIIAILVAERNSGTLLDLAWKACEAEPDFTCVARVSVCRTDTRRTVSAGRLLRMPPDGWRRAACRHSLISRQGDTILVKCAGRGCKSGEATHANTTIGTIRD